MKSTSTHIPLKSDQSRCRQNKFQLRGVVVVFSVLVNLAWPLATALANDVTVESKNVLPGAVNVKVGVYISNDVGITGLVLPLELRSIDPGAYVTSSFSFAQNTLGRAYNSPIGRSNPLGCENHAPSNCTWTNPSITSLRYPLPAAQTCSGPDAHTFSGQAAQIDFSSPDAILFATVSQDPIYTTLDWGSDPPGVPSYQFTFNVTSTQGSFEIDSCCVAPANHLVFVDVNTTKITPSFKAGTITVFDDDLAYWPDCGCRDIPGDQVITSAYGPRWLYRGPPTYTEIDTTDYHDGFDIKNGLNEPVYASAAGKVVGRQQDGQNGYYLRITATTLDLESVLRSYYAFYHHMVQPSLQIDANVLKGQVIGYSGIFGNVPGPHIHYEPQFNVFSFQGSHPLRFLRRQNNFCPEFDTMPGSKPAIVGTDYFKGTIHSTRDEQFDLNKIIVRVYVGSEPGKDAVVDFEDSTTMAEWENSTKIGVMRFYEGTAFDVTVTLMPHELHDTDSYKVFDLTVDPVAPIYNSQWIGIELRDINTSNIPAASYTAGAASYSTTCGLNSGRYPILS